MSKKYYPTIGLEIHAELKTNSKMFSGSVNNPDEEKPNTNVGPIDLAHPGTLPVINMKAVEHMIRVGLAVDGEIANFTEFDRKNYFYPDIPKGYQISQYLYPIVSKGNIGGVDITRIHLEEDTGTSKHKDGHSLVDYNRAGVPLLELVTEPVIRSGKQASDFAKNFRQLLQYLEASDANMEKGEMRVEANISISTDPDKLGTKVEIKNLNSFKVVEKAIAYELERMEMLHEAGREDEIIQETRGWDDEKASTFSQRAKEDAHDYRYFPDPDIPKLHLHEIFDLEELKNGLPELPWEKRDRYQESFGIKNDDQVEILIKNKELADYFESVVGNINKEEIQLAVNYITSDIISLVSEEGNTLPSVDNFSKLINMIGKNELSSRGAKDILSKMFKEDTDPYKIAEEEGLLQQNDEEGLKVVIKKVIDENLDVVEEYKGGKESVLQFFVGQGMKETKGGANPQILAKIAKELLG